MKVSLAPLHEGKTLPVQVLITEHPRVHDKPLRVGYCGESWDDGFTLFPHIVKQFSERDCALIRAEVKKQLGAPSYGTDDSRDSDEG